MQLMQFADNTPQVPLFYLLNAGLSTDFPGKKREKKEESTQNFRQEVRCAREKEKTAAAFISAEEKRFL